MPFRLQVPRAARVHLTAIGCTLFASEDEDAALAAFFAASESSLTLDSLRTLQRLVVWLEDRKVRLLPIAERASLRKTISDDASAAHFREACAKYLELAMCPCPFSDGKETACAMWLLSHATSIEYEDAPSRHNLGARKFLGGVAAESESIGNENGDPEMSADDVKRVVREILRETRLWIDAQSAEASADVDVLSKLGELAGTIEEKLSATGDSVNLTPHEAAMEAVERMGLGFSTGDAAVDKAAAVLKMIYTADMRQLQRGINSIFAACQAFTADPKVNSKLGKVGR